MSWTQRIAAFKKTWAFVVLFLVVLGGIYLGVFTATEAASVGAIGAYLFALARGSMRSGREYLDVIGGAVGISAAIFAIASCALVFSQFINVTGMPFALMELVNGWELSGIQLVLAIGALCILLGMVFEALGILVLIVPMFLSTLQAQGVDMIWFGVVVIILIELGLITPRLVSTCSRSRLRARTSSSATYSPVSRPSCWPCWSPQHSSSSGRRSSSASPT